MCFILFLLERLFPSYFSNLFPKICPTIAIGNVFVFRTPQFLWPTSLVSPASAPRAALAGRSEKRKVDGSFFRSALPPFKGKVWNANGIWILFSMFRFFYRKWPKWTKERIHKIDLVSGSTHSYFKSWTRTFFEKLLFDLNSEFVPKAGPFL